MLSQDIAANSLHLHEVAHECGLTVPEVKEILQDEHLHVEAPADPENHSFSSDEVQAIARVALLRQLPDWAVLPASVTLEDRMAIKKEMAEEFLDRDFE
jgi:hypothetical protein